MSCSVALACSCRTGRIKVQACSGSTAQCQQPAPGLPCAIFIMSMSKSVLKRLKEISPLSNRVPMARASGGASIFKSDCNCCPKQGKALHRGLAKTPDDDEEEDKEERKKGW